MDRAKSAAVRPRNANPMARPGAGHTPALQAEAAAAGTGSAVMNLLAQLNAVLPAGLSIPSKADPRNPRRPMPTDLAERREIVVKAKLVDYVYHRDPARLPTNWQTSDEIASTLSRMVNLPVVRDAQGGILSASSLAANQGLPSVTVQNAHGTFSNPRSGLMGTTFVNHQDKVIELSLGGTTAGPNVGETADDRLRDNKLNSFVQWGANIYGALGSIPQAHREANDLYLAAKSLTAQGQPLEGYTVRVSGHSLGGGMATYVSMTNGLKVDVFAAAALHEDVVNTKLPQSNVDNAERLVNIFYVAGDPVSEKLKNMPGMRALGTEHVVQPDPAHGTSMRECHESFAAHFESDLARFEAQHARDAATLEKKNQ